MLKCCHGCQAACMLENCSLSEVQLVALTEEGYLSLKDFALNHYQDISKFAERVQALPVNRGGMQFRQLHIIKLKAFLYWLKDCQHRDLPLNLDDGGFGENKLVAAVIEYHAEIQQLYHLKDDSIGQPK